MRIVHDAHRDTSSFALDTRTEYSGCPAEDGSPRSRPNESRHKFPAAISWLAALLIESFAAYGEAMYPCFVDPGDLINIGGIKRMPTKNGPGDRLPRAIPRSQVRFALDSSLEGDGFEPSVPGRETVNPIVGDGTACSKTGADLLGNRKFESISLQRGVHCETDFRGLNPAEEPAATDPHPVPQAK